MARRLGRPPDDPDLRRAATGLGLDVLDLAALFEPATTDERLVRAARVHARLTRRDASGRRTTNERDG